MSGPKTVSVRVEDWYAQQAGGSYCGPCQDTTVVDCENGVNLLTSTSAKAKGSGQRAFPKINNFNIPKGTNRMMIVLASFEREHCKGNDCSLSNTTGVRVRDDFASNTYTQFNGESVPRLKARFTSPTGSVDYTNQLTQPFPHYFRQTIEPAAGPDGVAFLSRETYPFLLTEAEIQALLGGNNSGFVDIDLPYVIESNENANETILSVLVFENVAQDDTGVILAGLAEKPMNQNAGGDFSLPISMVQHPLSQLEQGVLLVGVNSRTDGFQTTNGFEEIEGVHVNNNVGGYSEFNEGDGFSTSIQFRNGTIGNPLFQFDLQAAGGAGDVSNGGYGMAFLLNSCNGTDETATPVVYIDNDNDGFLANVHANNSSYDPDDANACDPDPTNFQGTCVGADEDEDGFYANYPTDHELYDVDDNNACFPIACQEICDNGIDDDGDGQIDCADGDCGTPTITSVNEVSPTDCTTANNGQITITATGSFLVYSIDEGTTFDISPVFENLAEGTYTIAVKNTITNCKVYYPNTITLVAPSCQEICDNNIDDDGDGLVDTHDTDCDCPLGFQNMALGKTATQSTTIFNGIPSRAVDGDRNGVYSENSVSHTGDKHEDWWEVDLGEIRDIQTINIWNRTDCCAERLSDFYVFVSDTPFNSNDPAVTAADGTVWNTYTSTCLLYTSPSPRDATLSRMPSSA